LTLDLLVIKTIFIKTNERIIISLNIAKHN